MGRPILGSLGGGGARPNSATDNPERARFCTSCGAELSLRCPECGAENPPGAKFCMECGTGLSPGASAAAGTAAPAAAESPPEERRQATVVFADLSGYTSA